MAWGLYFFNENLFEVVPQMLAKVGRAFAQQFPGETFEVRPAFSSSAPGSAAIATATLM